MKTIPHELDEGFQKASLMILALVALYESAAILGATDLFNTLRGPYDDIGIIAFGVLNTMFCYGKRWLRFSIGSTIIDWSYALFLCIGVGGLTYLFANVLRETFKVL